MDKHTLIHTHSHRERERERELTRSGSKRFGDFKLRNVRISDILYL